MSGGWYFGCRSLCHSMNETFGHVENSFIWDLIIIFSPSRPGWQQPAQDEVSSPKHFFRFVCVLSFWPGLVGIVSKCCQWPPHRECLMRNDFGWKQRPPVFSFLVDWVPFFYAWSCTCPIDSRITSIWVASHCFLLIIFTCKMSQQQQPERLDGILFEPLH